MVKRGQQQLNTNSLAGMTVGNNTRIGGIAGNLFKGSMNSSKSHVSKLGSTPLGNTTPGMNLNIGPGQGLLNPDLITGQS
jgi:hypothetical protein